MENQPETKRGWDLNDALEFIRALEPMLDLHCEAHCGLIGGVLKKGTSQKDLDLVIYPHKKDHKATWNVGDRKSVV